MEATFTVRAYLLQAPRIECNGEEIPIRLKRAAAVLYYVIVKQNAAREELAALIWPEENSELAHRHLRDILYYLGKQFPLKLIVPHGRSNLKFNPEIHLICDVALFQAGTGIDHYGGDFLDGFTLDDGAAYEEWVLEMRSFLRDQYLQRLEQMAKTAQAEQQMESAEQYWNLYLKEEPLSESAAAALMSLYRTQRNFNKAALVYRRLHGALADYLGISPLKETSALYRTIMSEWNDCACAKDDQVEELLIGRQALFEHLSKCFNTKKSFSMVLQGEAGVGKTHLLNHLLNHAVREPWVTITASCYKSKKDDPLYPWQAIMLSISNLIASKKISVPEQTLPLAATLFPVLAPASAVDSTNIKYPFGVDLEYDSIVSILAASSACAPLLLVFEDIQWMDRASLNLLDQALHKISPSRVLVAATCRQPADKNVTAFLDSAQEDHLLQRYTLQPFTREETMQFMEQSEARTFSSDLKERIYQDTQGNAFLLTQLINSLLEQGCPSIMPSNMNDIVSYRLSGLSAEGQQVLNLVAMFPDAVPYEVLEHISNKAPLDLLYICQELCRRSILAELQDGGQLSLVFAQPEFRDLVYAQIHPLSRRIIHLNIATALTHFTSMQVPGLTSQIIYHYQQGGDKRNALRYQIKFLGAYTYYHYALVSCSDSADDPMPNTDTQAMKHFQKVEKKLAELKAVSSDPELDQMENDILYAKACFCVFKGFYEAGVEALQTILAKPAVDPVLQELAHEQMMYYGIQTYNTAIFRAHLSSALDLTRGKHPTRYAINRRYYGYLLFMEGSYEESRIELKHSLELLRSAFSRGLDLTLQSSYAYNYIGEAYRKEGHYEQAMECYQCAIWELEQFGVFSWVSVFYTNCAHAAFAAKKYQCAKTLLEQAEKHSSYIQEPGGHRTIAYSYTALYAFSEGKDAEVCRLLQQAKRFADALQSPYEQGIVWMCKAIIRRRCDQISESHPAVSEFLNRPYAEYLSYSQTLLAGKAGRFEQEMLEALAQGNDEILRGFWQFSGSSH